MSYNSDHYTRQLTALLPRGALWESLIAPGKRFFALLQAIAAEFARVDDSAEQLLDETDPRRAYQLLPEWETFAALPDTCLGEPETIEQRRQNLHAKLTARGGQSRQYFIDLAERIGYPGATITEFTPHNVGMSVSAPLYGSDWAYAWALTAPDSPVQQLTVQSGVDESLGEVSPNKRLECAIARTKPAHTVVIHEYI